LNIKQEEEITILSVFGIAVAVVVVI